MSSIKRQMEKRAWAWNVEKERQLQEATDACQSSFLETKRAMKYRCEECGKEWWMWLQTGLEEHGEDHKPVPFGIRCKCGGTAFHVDWNEDKYLSEPIPITESMNYFANNPNHECGVSMIR